MAAIPKMFIVKFKNRELYSYVDDDVLADVLKDSFPQAVLEVNEVVPKIEYVRCSMCQHREECARDKHYRDGSIICQDYEEREIYALQDVSETDG
jgi:hypothetical protein